jgi:hypothetical protein
MTIRTHDRLRLLAVLLNGALLIATLWAWTAVLFSNP